MSQENTDPVLKHLITESHIVAEHLNHEHVTMDHIFAVLLEDKSIQKMIKDLSSASDLKEIKKEFKQLLEDPNLFTNTSTRKPVNTHFVNHMLMAVRNRAMQLGKTEVSAPLVLQEILVYSEKEEFCSTLVLKNHDITLMKVIRYIVDGQASATSVPKGEMTRDNALDIMEQHAVNLNNLVKEGGIDKLIGRDKEIFSLAKTLCRRTKNNAVLVGDAGVGKTAIPEGLAYRVVHKQVPKEIEKAVIFSVDVGSLVAGTKFRGDLEEKIKQILQAVEFLSKEKDMMPVLFIDELHNVVGAGAGSDKTMDISNILKPALQKGYLRCIGATTFDEYRKHIEKDAALRRRFQRIDVSEPSISEAIEILQGLKPAYEAFHKVTYSDSAIEQAVMLSAKYNSNGKLPDKAIDVIDAVGSKNKLMKGKQKLKVISDKEIMEELSVMTGIPADKMLNTGTSKLKDLPMVLRSKIFGQDQAIEDLNTSVLISQMGLREDNKTEGAFLFNGPTGVGKTELAVQLALYLQKSFLRLDMSEFMEKHSVAKLIGAPPGYVGYDGGGKMTNYISQHPSTVLLVDEVEKAHPDVFNIFLQVMDNGKISDSSGKDVDFRNVILIFTGNIGSAKVKKVAMGFGRSSDNAQEEEVKELFRPEFLNRFDYIITFNALTLPICELIVDKFIQDLNFKLMAKGVFLTLSEEVKQYLLKEGFDELYGARPLKRIIDAKIKKVLAPELAFGSLAKGGHAFVTMENGNIKFKIEETVKDTVEVC